MNTELIQFLCHILSLEVPLTYQQISTRINTKDNAALKFKLNSTTLVFSQAKITPQKIGQFACIYKRNEQNITQSYSESDDFEYMIIAVQDKEQKGVFIFPKKALTDLQIIHSESAKGKNGIRVYPSWDMPQNSQAIKTQKQHSPYFYTY